MNHTQQEKNITAAEFEIRLTRLLEEQFGAGRGSLSQRADKAALYLPADLARRVREMVQGIADLRSGVSGIDPLVFRASAEAVLASLAAPALRRATERRAIRDGLRYGLIGLLLLTPAIAFFFLVICIMLRIPYENGVDTVVLFMGVSAYLLWPSFLYWALDRAVKNAATASAGRGMARALVFGIFFWAVGAWIVAFYNVSRETREEEAREERSEISPSELTEGSSNVFDDSDPMYHAVPSNMYHSILRDQNILRDNDWLV